MKSFLVRVLVLCAQPMIMVAQSQAPPEDFMLDEKPT
jgi:hypothetical protein